ncbi:MAG: hypothetical protein HON68_08040 [Gammaproteobacteria bacterium]|nr:hypothetical protein [Gammaproteobacteria bacterium]MBT3489062.1 hypothetical protein [Gammaproteobacteria bacterium]MBT3718150.1 hypothetical protein [Gammaproteobacteria bacterium]MBT3844164.1 hypothetical protein [Gammaproteobacteria bacterium]MBT3893144.1 hypothetical protein [Gammaproteobacteria bacterium]
MKPRFDTVLDLLQRNKEHSINRLLKQDRHTLEQLAEQITLLEKILKMK